MMTDVSLTMRFRHIKASSFSHRTARLSKSYHYGLLCGVAVCLCNLSPMLGFVHVSSTIVFTQGTSESTKHFNVARTLTRWDLAARFKCFYTL